MPEFLQVLTYHQALQILEKNMPPRETEYLPLLGCNQRVLASDITSPEDMPAFDRSTVDGYAVRAADTFGSSESLPGMLSLTGEVLMGSKPILRVGRGQCAWIPTGGMLPEGSNAAIMVEYTEKLGLDTILTYRPVAPGENVMQKGEDVSQGEVVFRRGKVLKAQEIGLLASLGLVRLPVFEAYRIGVISTGDEVIPVDQIPLPGQVRDVNSFALAAALEASGAVVQLYPLIKDDYSCLRQALEKAWHENDLILMSGGSSVGVADFSLQAILSLPDAEVLFHGLAVKPGKPTIGARVGRKLIIGLPGHPVSALMIFYTMCAPLISSAAVNQVKARLTINLASQAGRDDFVPVQLLSAPGGPEAQPLLGKSGLMSILARADGYIHLPYEQQGIKGGEIVTVTRF
ncbi:MAG: molybdopterin molybdotransferase MoeA [Syntrophomonadaceae bacterium]|nr:molybdopterin molybdotransferase MoeA [Syntrophomonadaceae bacterium]